MTGFGILRAIGVRGGIIIALALFAALCWHKWGVWKDKFGDLSDEERAVVSEAGLQSTRKVVVKTKGQKIAALVHQAVMEIARKAGDPVYKQYESHRKQEVLLRRKLEKKYSGQARAVVNQVVKDKK